MDKNRVNKVVLELLDKGLSHRQIRDEVKKRWWKVSLGKISSIRRNQWDHYKKTQEVTKTQRRKSMDISCNKSSRIKTLDQLLEAAEVDRTMWDVDHYTVNKYEQASKDDEGNANITELFQIKAKLKRLSWVSYDNVCRSLLEQIGKTKKNHPKNNLSMHCNESYSNLLEINIFDAHIGKLAWSEETGDGYNLEEAERRYNKVFDILVARATAFNIDRVLYVVGNDFFHIDNNRNTTTAGTPQDTDGRANKIFLKWVEIIKNSLDSLSSLGVKVDVMVISWNHDNERCFFMWELLNARYRDCERISVNNTPKLRKYYNWGKCLIGFAHWDGEKHKDLPMMMATENPKLWAETKYREWHLGHLHQEKTVEIQWVKVRIMPSISWTDYWHMKKWYVGNIKGAKAFIWNKEEWQVAEFTTNL